jgi:hypothetical protein
MVLLATSVLWRMTRLTFADTLIFSDQTLWFQFTILLVVNINAILMDRHLIPLWLGPAIAGGSWYSYFFSVILAPLSLSYPSLLLCWVYLIIALILVFRVLDKLTGKKK